MTMDRKTDNNNGKTRSSAPFRVLGIALVLDQLGKEARMAFRYPTSVVNKNNNKGTPTKGVKGNEELFFTLSSRQMAKLFRPKHSLCGQPMTLSVGGTVFCFRAVWMGEPEAEQPPPSSSASITSANTQSTSNSNKGTVDHLVLFSVIVALAPQVDMSSMPISGWFEGREDDKSDLNQSMHRPFSSSSSLCSSEGGGVGSPHSSHAALKEDASRASASFLAIRRVQVSLTRLCRVLEREERRCRYISIQSQYFFQIRADLQEKFVLAGSVASKPSGSSPKTQGQVPAPKKHHKRGDSFSTALLGGSMVKDVDCRSSAQLSTDNEQEVLEHILASGPQDGISPAACTDQQQHGNLGRELVQVFHALSRNDHNFPPSPSVLSGRDGVVYVNRHIAVALEAASLPRPLSPENRSNTTIAVRPYHTLIFPNASPSQLLQALQSSGFTAPLQQLLLMVRPSKPLMDIAIDANLPLSVTMELANYLVGHGACVASTVLTRASRLACKNVNRIQELALDFSQTFDDWSVSLFLIVSFLTTNDRTLGESMTALTRGEDEVGSSLRSSILSSMFHEPDTTDDYILVEKPAENVAGSSGYESPAHSEDLKQQQQHQLLHPRAEELEEVLYSMAIWLLSHQVLGHIQDYLVLAGSTAAISAGGHNNAAPSSTFPHAAAADLETTSKEKNVAPPAMESSDTGLLRELQESDCLNGSASIAAICWRLSLDEEKLRSWALRRDKLRIVSRVAESGDDWGG